MIEAKQWSNNEESILKYRDTSTYRLYAKTKGRELTNKEVEDILKNLNEFYKDMFIVA